jgi:hypothetical protein
LFHEAKMLEPKPSKTHRFNWQIGKSKRITHMQFSPFSSAFLVMLGFASSSLGDERYGSEQSCI